MERFLLSLLHREHNELSLQGPGAGGDAEVTASAVFSWPQCPVQQWTGPDKMKLLNWTSCLKGLAGLSVCTAP